MVNHWIELGALFLYQLYHSNPMCLLAVQDATVNLRDQPQGRTLHEAIPYMDTSDCIIETKK